MREGVVKVLNFFVSAHEIFVGFAQLGLNARNSLVGLFSRRNVHHHSLDLRGLAALGTDTDGVAQPNDSSVGGDDAVFDDLMLMVGLKLFDDVQDAVTIAGMNVVQPKI